MYKRQDDGSTIAHDDNAQSASNEKRDYKGKQGQDWQFINTNWPGMFVSYNFYKQARSFVNLVIDNNLMDDFRKYMIHYCDYANPSMNIISVTRTFWRISVMLFSEKKAQHLNLSECGDILLRVCKFAVPTIGMRVIPREFYSLVAMDLSNLIHAK